MARHDIDEKTITEMLALCHTRFQHPNAFAEGQWVEEGDYRGFRAKTPDGSEDRFFISTQPSDLSIDWLNVTDYRDRIEFMPTGALLTDDNKRR